MKNLLKGIVYRFGAIAILAAAIFVSASSCEYVLADSPDNSPHPCDSLKDRKTEVTFTIVGQAEDAKWGWGQTSDVFYKFTVNSTSKFKVEKLKNGGRKVIEERKYENAMDQMIVAPTDFHLRLSTIPIDEIHQVFDIFALLSGHFVVKCSSDYAFKTIKKYDNESLSDLLKYYAQDYPVLKHLPIEKLLQKVFQTISKKYDHKTTEQRTIEFMKKAFLNEDSIIKEFQGARNLIFSKKNVFRITWTIDKDGNVTGADYRYADGSPVTDEETNLIIKRGTLLVDYCITRSDDTLKNGASWKVSANDIQSVFDPFVDGDYKGNITVVAQKQNQDKWELKMKPTPLKVEASRKGGSETTGNLNITSGSIVVSDLDDSNALKICDLKGSKINANVEGRAQMKHLAKHHWLFTAKFTGECKFFGEMKSEEIKK